MHNDKLTDSYALSLQQQREDIARQIDDIDDREQRGMLWSELAAIYKTNLWHAFYNKLGLTYVLCPSTEAIELCEHYIAEAIEDQLENHPDFSLALFHSYLYLANSRYLHEDKLDKVESPPSVKRCFALASPWGFQGAIPEKALHVMQDLNLMEFSQGKKPFSVSLYGCAVLRTLNRQHGPSEAQTTFSRVRSSIDALKRLTAPKNRKPNPAISFGLLP